jgi:hypothetical protein
MRMILGHKAFGPHMNGSAGDFVNRVPRHHGAPDVERLIVGKNGTGLADAGVEAVRRIDRLAPFSGRLIVNSVEDAARLFLGAMFLQGATVSEVAVAQQETTAVQGHPCRGPIPGFQSPWCTTAFGIRILHDCFHAIRPGS